MTPKEDAVRLSPMDEFNQELLSQVRPSEWQNPKPASRYNLMVLGGGTAGLVAAAGAAGLGAKVALVEKNLMGGDCLNVGCVPSKALIRAARAAADAKAASHFGIRGAAEGEADFAAVMDRLRRIRSHISHHDSAERFRNLGVDVFLGEGRFLNHSAAGVNGTVLRFKKAVIATGGRPAIPPITGLQDAGFLTNETVFNLTQRPRRLAIIGGGPIGCELAQAFRRLGSEVTIVEMMAQFLPREDADAAKILAEALEKEGIEVRLRTGLRKVVRKGNDKELYLESEGRESSLTVDEIFVGVGRLSNVEGLDLEKAGIRYSKKGVEVNDFLQTSNPCVYAAGDISLAHKFTHTADAAARIVVQNALFGGKKRASSLMIPSCTYTDPEIAHVGLYEREAAERGISITTFFRPLSEVDRAVIEGEEKGFVKIHVKKGTDRILGATIVARHAGEMISEVTLAMAGKIGLGAVASVIHPYPTQAEGIKQAADAYNRTRLTPFVKSLLKMWLRWTR